MLEHYIWNGHKKLRCGITTGSCATLAAKAAAIMLLGGDEISHMDLTTPKGIWIQAEILDITIGSNFVRCAVKKDAGDDKDVTHEMLIYATVKASDYTNEKSLIKIEGGSGVGRVTKKGLDQPVGEAAINSVPRQMIENALLEVIDDFSFEGGLSVLIEADGGEELAKKTFNPSLGIVGGISIIGTSGIVEPMSLKALIDSIELEFKILKAEGKKKCFITPGNYGIKFIESNFRANDINTIKCSNFIGDSIDFALRYEFEDIIIIGHMGKMVKLAGNMLNTHSMYGDCRKEIFAAYAGSWGAGEDIIRDIMNAATSDGCIEILKKDNILFEKTIHSISISAQENIRKRGTEALNIGLITFTNEYGLLSISDEAKKILNKWGIEYEG